MRLTLGGRLDGLTTDAVPPAELKVPSHPADEPTRMAPDLKPGGRWQGRLLISLGQLSAALTGAIVFEIAIVVGAPFRSPETHGRYTSTLLTGRQDLPTVLLLVARNAPLLLAVGLLAWRLGDAWDRNAMDKVSTQRLRVARAVYTFLVAAVAVALWWMFTGQAAALSTNLVSPWVLLIALPHGPLEFAALLFPFVAVSDSIRRRLRTPGRAALSSLGLSTLLLVCAASIETFVSPLLVTIPNLQR